MNNTLKNKAKFFALYWGQKVLHQNRYKYNPRCVNEHSFSSYHSWASLDEDYLLLKPLSNFAIKYLADSPDHYYRTEGYALPWCGISVEQQIEYGWIKLIENE